MADQGREPVEGGTRRAIVAETTRWCDRGVVEVIEGPGTGRRVEVGARIVIVGRDEGCDLCIPDAQVSAAHLELSAEEDGVTARDLHTTNGTWVGSLRIREAVLGDGTELRVGGAVLRFGYDETPARLQRKEVDRFHRLIGASPAMQLLYAQLEQLAPTDLPLLVEGETGTGKEEVARTVHEISGRAAAPFVVVDCGALSATLLESTLFGHERGAFSGATERRIGLLEAADGGTVFFDELGELPLEAQTRLLRFLESGTLRRVGSHKEQRVDVRVVSATHRDIPSMVASGGFRADLFFRLAPARVRLPPLRERREDVPRLADALLARLGGPPRSITAAALSALGRRDYPGNVRELRNVLSVAAAVAGGRAIDVDAVRRHAAETPPGVPVVPRAAPPAAEPSFDTDIGLYRDEKARLLDRFEESYLRAVLERHGGNLSHAAAHAGIERHHLRRLMKKHGIVVARRR